MYLSGQGNPLCCFVVLYVGEGSEREQCCLLSSRPTFRHYPMLPESRLCPLSCCPGADSWVGGFVYVLGSCGPLQGTVLIDWEFIPPPQPPQALTARGSEALSAWHWNPGLHGLSHSWWLLSVYLHINVGPSALPASVLPAQSSSHCLAVQPLHPACPSPPILSVWMNVSSLTPWFSDFHTVRLSGRSGCLLFLNLLFSFFWLCKEAKCIYLCLHPGQKTS